MILPFFKWILVCIMNWGGELLHIGWLLPGELPQLNHPKFKN